MGRTVEILALAAMVFAFGIGGGMLLAHVAQFRLIGAVVLIALAIVQLAALRAPETPREETVGLRRTGRLLFIVATVLAIAYVLVPARWSSGAAIVALECGLVLEILARVVPGRSSA